MGQIIDGKKIAEKIKDDITQEIYNLHGQRPNLAIILVGDREDSKLYVDLKQKQAKAVGIDTHFYRLATETSEKELLAVIDCLNKDELIDGILVQLPLPKHFDTDVVVNAIFSTKDVDGFHKESLARDMEDNVLLSPVFASILRIFEEIECNIANRGIVILYNSEIFGQSLAKRLENRKAKVNLIQYKEIANRKKEITQADIVITALGQPQLLTKSYFKNEVIVIDIGITKQDKKVFGDVNFKNVLDKVSYITPVPGGIGPMTIAMLFNNTLQAFKNRHK